jgi:hypothetical protein
VVSTIDIHDAYTTLGYGDVTPVERWRLLGPMTAMNGVLLFGWSTAVIFEVLRKAMNPVDGNQPNPEAAVNSCSKCQARWVNHLLCCELSAVAMRVVMS